MKERLQHCPIYHVPCKYGHEVVRKECKHEDEFACTDRLLGFEDRHRLLDEEMDAWEDLSAALEIYQNEPF